MFALLQLSLVQLDLSLLTTPVPLVPLPLLLANLGKILIITKQN
jgi:hypothetical protein